MPDGAARTRGPGDTDVAGVAEGPGVADAPDIAAIRFDERGLVPVIVQDRATRDVLMLGYADAEAMHATRNTGFAHFHSRSRDRLWQKGETSGNVLRVRGVRVDCDGDALLLAVDPAGPTCHTGARTCFDPPDRPVEATSRPPADAPARPPRLEGFAWLEVLWATIRRRATERPEGSYTARLLDGGVDAVARKVVEEAMEVLMAAKDDAHETGGPNARTGADTRGRLVEETADLLYHVLVLAAERGIPPADVMDELRRRHSA
jgi:phosphoribosyl-AMP cyclohydrolase / phosphoribosyl-ATP pyrophosphohydrolase